MSPVVRGLTSVEAATHPEADDPRLRGRTYAIPFAKVWDAALALAGGGVPRWRLLSWDDLKGTIHAKRTNLLTKRASVVRIDIVLDENAQTRVDLRARSEGRRGDLGGNARAIARFLRLLDRRVEATPAQVIDVVQTP